MGYHLKLNLAQQNSEQEPWNPEQALARALAERARFLEKHPRHRPFQNQIDQLLGKAGSAENRFTVLALLIETKLVELYRQLQRLNAILLRASA